MITFTVLTHWILLGVFAIMPFSPHLKQATKRYMYFGRGQTADISSYVAGLAQTNKFSSGTTVFDICQHSIGKKVSIGRFNKIISFFLSKRLTETTPWDSSTDFISFSGIPSRS